MCAIADSGITHVHWSHEWDSTRLYSSEEMLKVRAMLSEYGLKVKGIHASAGWEYSMTPGLLSSMPQVVNCPDYTSADESLRKAGSELIRNRLELAAVLETREIVLHMQLPYVRFSDKRYKENYYGQACKSLEENQRTAEENGIRICFENLVGTPNGFQSEEFRFLFERFSPEYVGFCCDTGHSYLTDPNDPFALAREFRNRMYMIHLNENHSNPLPGDFSDDVRQMRCDEHRVIGDGVIDFAAFAGILADSPYEMPAVAEFVVHEETENDFLKKSRVAIEKFTESVLSIRKKK